MYRFPLALLLLTMAAGISLAQEPALTNAGFETWEPAFPDANGLIAGWKLGDPPETATGWTLNSTYTGQLLRGTDGSPEGKAHAILRRTGANGAHIYQAVPGLQPGQWYRFSARARGGTLVAMMYQYFQSGPMNSVSIARGEGSPQWRTVTGYYQVPAVNWASSSLAVCLEGGEQVEVDDVKLEVATVPTAPADAPDIVLENDTVRLVLTPTALLKQLQDKASGTEYQAGAPLPMVRMTVDGIPLQACVLTRKDDRLEFGFPEPEARLVLKVIPGSRHFRFEVLGISPPDAEVVEVSLPVRRLATVGGAFNATYDTDFGLCFFGTTPNANATPRSAGTTTFIPTITGVREHGMVGLGMALVAAPRAQFEAAIMETERASGLPCPMSGGKWMRNSESVRRSYLFSTGTTEADIDTLIEYAKIGGFGTIIFLKNDWLANHGHFDINLRNFPSGLAGLQEAVRKIHAAGLEAGVHVFGPSISPDDPFVTPVPHRDLASVPLPPLAEAMTETSTTLTFTEAPNIPPKIWDYAGFPGHYVRLGDEIIAYDPKQMEGDRRYLNVTRGALGTKPAAYPAGTEAKGLLAMWGFLLPDPDSPLADEVTTNFAKVFNACDFDFVYFDASDGSGEPYIDRWYFLNKMHLMYYRKFKRDALYQTSNGPGSGLVWHIVPRSASADGHGDIKGYLDDRWPAILGMADNFTKADVGWYYWFSNVRPDQIEYVAAKVLGVDGSISLETSRAALESLPQSRQMMEALGRWERCRRQGYFSEAVREKLREPQRDFKLFPDGDGWKLYRAVYEDPRSVDLLDGNQNTWVVNNDRPEPCLLGLEIVRSTREVAVQGYDSPQALPLEVFDRAEAYLHSEANPYERFVLGEKKVVSESGVVREGVTHRYAVEPAAGREGGPALVYEALNQGAEGGWTGIGRRFVPALDLSAYRGVGLWIHGDGQGESLRLQFRDTAGRNADWVPKVDFVGWRLHTFKRPDGDFDWSQVEYFLVYFNGLPSNEPCRVVLDGLRMLPAVTPGDLPGSPVVIVNGQRFDFGVTLQVGEAVTHEGVGEAMLWPRGMAPGRPLSVAGLPVVLPPGENHVTLDWNPKNAFPSAIDVLLYRLWPMEETP